MTDTLLELSKNPQARKLIGQLGLPIPMPMVLDRQRGAQPEQPLMDQAVLFGGRGDVGDEIARALVLAGANALVCDEELAKPFAEPGEAYGRLPRVVAREPELNGSSAKKSNGKSKHDKVKGIVFDATRLDDPAALRELYDLFHPWVGQLDKNGRVVVVGRSPASARNAAQAAARSALEGFVRSVAKEVGRKGATANLLYVEEGAEGRLAGPLRFFLSASSTFVTAQPLTVSSLAAHEGDVPWVRSLAGKVALVTGAARGIGAATAEILAAEGAHVVCLDRPADDGPVSQVARNVGGSVLLADVTDPDAPNTIATSLRAEHGGVDIVIHNAGITRDKTLGRMKPAFWEQAIDVNLGAVERITTELAKQTLRDGGRIVTLSSVAGIAGNVGQTNYAASKSGIIGYTKHMSAQLAGRGITVNAIAPGFIETRLTAAIPVMIREAGRRMSALGQGGQPADVGQAIAFLTTPGAAGLTGNVLRVCGGALLGA